MLEKYSDKRSLIDLNRKPYDMLITALEKRNRELGTKTYLDSHMEMNYYLLCRGIPENCTWNFDFLDL